MNLLEKPFQLTVTIVFGLLAIFGLILFSNFRGFGGGDASAGKVAIWGTLPQSAIDLQIDALRTENKAFAGVSYTEIALENFSSFLSNSIASGSGPDMVLITQEQLLSEQSKLAVIPAREISERDYLDTFVPITELFLTTTGTYGVPLVVDPLVLYYNKTTLSSAGVALPPASWEAVNGLAERITIRSGAEISQSAIAFGEYDNIENARGIISLLLLQSGTPITIVNEFGVRAVLGERTNVGALGLSATDSAINFYTQFADPAKTVYTWNRARASARQAFLAGDLALYIGYASELPILSNGNPNLSFDMARIPQPQVSSTRATFARAYAFAIPKASSNPEGALSTALELTSTAQSLLSADSLSMTPARRVLLTEKQSDKFKAVFYPEALISKGWLSPSQEATDTIFRAMIGNISSGRADIPQAITTASQAIDAAL